MPDAPPPIPAPDATGTVHLEALSLFASCEENLAFIKELFKEDFGVIVREYRNQWDSTVCGFLVCMDGMTNSLTIQQNILEPLQTLRLGAGGAFESMRLSMVSAHETSVATHFGDVVSKVLYGDTAVFLAGTAKALIVGTKGFSLRGISEPDDEKALRGPREGFTESLMTNMSMLRRKIQTPDLKFIPRVFGTRSNTRACLCYLDSLVDKKILAELNRRLDSVVVDGVLDVQYLIERVRDAKYSLFKTIGESEKPDVVAARLLEGRVALILDGTPLVLTAPYLLVENFQSPDDYYLSFYYATSGRILRMLAFFLAVFTPAVYAALLGFHKEMIPTPLLLSIAAAIQGVPFPVAAEVLGMSALFEVLSETGLRMPNKMGQALSIVGALVVGQAAVDAKIVSAYTVIVVALTGIAGLMVPRCKSATLLLRLTALLAASCLGLYGCLACFAGLIIYLCSLRSLGVPCTEGFLRARPREGHDALIRSPHPSQRSRPRFLAKDRRRAL